MKTTQEYHKYMVGSLKNDGWTIDSQLITVDGMKYILSNSVHGCLLLALGNWGEYAFYGSGRDVALFDSSVYELRDNGTLRDYGKQAEAEGYFNWKNTPQEVIMDVLTEQFV